MIGGIMALLELSNISYVVKEKSIIRDVSLSVHEGEYLTVVGPSGSGKSTLLKLCSDLISPTSGIITYNGRDLTTIDPESYRKEVGYCFQRPYLFAKTVRRNILFPYDIRGMEPDMIRIKYLFDLLHMPIEYLERHNDELSGGEMQRVLLARAILNKPNLLVLDEPTQGVDMTGQAELYQLIHQTQKRLNCAILMVSHDLHIVMADTNEVLCINQHICCAGTPETVSNDPTFIHFFGDQFSKNIAVYTHHHNHRHDMHGDICNIEPKQPH